MDHIEIESCVMRAKNGSEEDMLKLLDHYKFFIYKCIGEYHIKGFSAEDLLQTGYLSLITAVTRYTCGNHTFSCYAMKSIKNALIYTYRRNAKSNYEISLNEPVGLFENTDKELLDCISSPSDLEEDIVNLLSIETLKEALSTLSQQDVELLKAVYFNKCSVKAYARRKGLNYITVIRKRNKLLKKLGCLLIDQSSSH